MPWRAQQKMKYPPSAGRIFAGFIVVRNLGKKNQYETWMPDGVFEKQYKKIEKTELSKNRTK